ncbi:sigma-70 family RNA polymerase sigma factor [Bacillus suaedaesalsae]|uniref:Sigma-70 family RNA polymerase sigma factor n=1 Tax=Bacillus suaedaesalsae TaxID=2810349 RepID=A0ABS2DEK2_9BACI|nr:sigma-70 family RNA polymerase sigma factor [Bacillus suaedaesalsae]MBM6616878.1 sigma-70 family RNA polymerase sigma factor [Bacillus suaedaesalsae]
MDESRLVRKAIKGNKEAFQQLLVLHSDQLYRTAYLYVGNREDALDVVQETSYKAYMAINSLRNEDYFLTWLTKILIHCSYDVLHRKRKEVLTENMKEISIDKKPKTEEHIDLVRGLSELKEEYRSTLILFYYRDLPIVEISRILEVPENTVKTYLQRGKKQLKQKLGGSSYYEGEIVS